METQDLNDTLDEMELIDIFRTFHPSRNKFKRNETTVKINKTKSWFLEKINKIDQTRQEKKRKIKSTKLEMKKERLTDNAEMRLL